MEQHRTNQVKKCLCMGLEVAARLSNAVHFPHPQTTILPTKAVLRDTHASRSSQLAFLDNPTQHVRHHSIRRVPPKAVSHSRNADQRTYRPQQNQSIQGPECRPPELIERFFVVDTWKGLIWYFIAQEFTQLLPTVPTHFEFEQISATLLAHPPDVFIVPQIPLFTRLWKVCAMAVGVQHAIHLRESRLGHEQAVEQREWVRGGKAELVAKRLKSAHEGGVVGVDRTSGEDDFGIGIGIEQRAAEEDRRRVGDCLQEGMSWLFEIENEDRTHHAMAQQLVPLFASEGFTLELEFSLHRIDPVRGSQQLVEHTILIAVHLPHFSVGKVLQSYT